MSCDAPNDSIGCAVVEREEGVVLLGGQSGLRLEPVREVRRAACDRPLLDRLRDARRDLDVELFSVADGGDELGVHVLRQLVAHLARAEGVDAEVLRCARVRAVFVERGRQADLAFGDLTHDGFSGRQRRRGH